MPRSVNTFGKLILMAGVAAAAFAPAGQAIAQTQDDEPEARQSTVFVTATRRSQNVRDLAGNVSVVTGGDLEDLSAASFEDYIRLVPGVQFNDTGTAQGANITIRGVSSSAGTGITQQTTGIYIDETPFSDVFGFISAPDLSPFDLERVEVLRGPQGALYGSGSMGGAIRYVTAKPQFDTFEAKVNGALSYTEDGGPNTLTQGALNIPLAENLALRGVLSYRTEDGYLDNALIGQKDTNGLDQFHGRVALKWAPTDRLNVLANYLYQETDTDGTGLFEGPVDDDPVTALTPPFDIDFKYEIASLAIEYDLLFADALVSASYAGKERAQFSDLGPASTLATLAGFDAGLSASLGAVGAYTPGSIFDAGLTSFVTEGEPDSDARFIEFRLTSKSDQRFRWLLGGLYTDIDNFNPIIQSVPGLNDVLTGFTVPDPFVPLFGAPNAAALFGIPENDVILDFFQESEATELAVYGEVQFDVTDRLEVTAGGRYFDFDVNTQLGLGGAVLADIENDVSEFQPRLTIGYRPNDDVLTYFVFSRGYRVGGVNDTIALTLAPGQSLTDSPAPLTYDTDDLFNYEIGIKSDWLNGAVTADIGFYYIDWSDIQLASFFPAPATPTGGVQAISNAGDASIYGIEAQLISQLSDNIQFQSSLSWNDAELTENSPLVPNVETGMLVSAPNGTQLPGSREWQISNNIVVTGSLAGRDATFTVSHQYASSTINDFALQAPLDSYNLFGVQADYQLTDRLVLGAFARNITDEREAVQLQAGMPALNLPRAFAITRPRTMGVRVSASF